jgi:hypothetical protein
VESFLFDHVIPLYRSVIPLFIHHMVGAEARGLCEKQNWIRGKI